MSQLVECFLAVLVASSRKKNSGENDGQLMAPRSLSIKLSGNEIVSRCACTLSRSVLV